VIDNILISLSFAFLARNINANEINALMFKSDRLLKRDAIGLNRPAIAAITQETEAPTPNGRGADLASMPTCYKACPLPF
jgi:hypothetical protein